MKIEFKKITAQPKSFSISNDGLTLHGEVKRVDERLFRLTSFLQGEITLLCDRTGESYQESLNEPLVLYISNGIWNIQSQKTNDSFDVIEFFDGFIDFEYILQSEIDSIQMQYHTKEGE